MMSEQLPDQIARVAVVGGGISGLSAAHFLLLESRRLGLSVQVTLMEAASRLGGVIETREREGFLLEGGPDSFISEKPWGVKLCQEIGLGPNLIGTGETHRRSFIVSRGNLLPIPEGFYLLAPTQIWPFLTTSLFSWSGKLRMAADLVLPRRNGATAPSDESLANFVRRRLGKEALERIAQPLVSGIYTADPELLSLQASMPRFLDLERRYRSIILGMLFQRRKMLKVQKSHSGGPRYGLFVSLDKGMSMLIERLQTALPSESILLRSRVRSVVPLSPSPGWQLRLDNGTTCNADAVCMALPAFQTARLVEGIDPSLAELLNSIDYASTATINLAYRREDIPHPLDGFGFVVPAIEERPLLACTFSHIKFEGRAPEGYALLRAFVGGASQPKAFDMDDVEMVRTVRGNLRDLLGIQAEPVLVNVERHPQAMAQYRVGHLQLVQSIESRLASWPLLQIAGNGMTGIGIPDCVHRGEHCAQQILAGLLKARPSRAGGSRHTSPAPGS
jgi:protoporphyrinogen/coproporphyrinogen III oxidase